LITQILLDIKKKKQAERQERRKQKELLGKKRKRYTGLEKAKIILEKMGWKGQGKLFITIRTWEI
jgi:hypothetical protein